jgi:hypothetical protein
MRGTNEKKDWEKKKSYSICLRESAEADDIPLPLEEPK